MKNYEAVIELIFNSNNGQIDLLTGALAPEQFDQIAKRDIAISDRNSTEISIISIALDLHKYLTIENKLDEEKTKSDIEAELVKLHFELKNLFRQSDCICRVSKLGFWILLSGIDEVAIKQVLDRASKTLPEYVASNLCQRVKGEKLLDWYKRVDKLHFSNNK